LFLINIIRSSEINKICFNLPSKIKSAQSARENYGQKFDKIIREFVAKKITIKQNGFIYLNSGYFLHYLQNKTATTELN